MTTADKIDEMVRARCMRDFVENGSAPNRYTPGSREHRVWDETVRQLMAVVREATPAEMVL